MRRDRHEIVTIIEPALEPLTVDEAKAYCRLTDDNDLAFLPTFIAAARRMVETRAGSRIMAQTIDVVRDDFPRDNLHGSRPTLLNCHPTMSLGVGNVRAVASVKYRDVAGTEQTMSSTRYRAILDTAPAVILPTGYWPDVADEEMSVRIRLETGHETQAEVDASVKTAVAMLAAHLFETRMPASERKLVELPIGLGLESLIDSWPQTHYKTGALG